jgi:TetR/AcrR family transcriptional repressor of nem operon
MFKGDQVREQVLAKAAGLFNRQGFRATSISDLLAATGVKKGSLYFHFPGKRELGLAVLTRARGGFIKFLQHALQGSTAWERLEGFFDAALAKHRKCNFVGGCLWGNTALEMADEDPKYSRLVADVFEEWIALIETVIADGQRAGEMRTDLPARALARHVVATVEGGIMLSRLSKSAGPLRDCLNGLRRMLQLSAAHAG